MKIVNEFYLNPVCDRAKSYYKKAKVAEYDNGEKRLYSYGTHVATIDGQNNFHKIWNGYSATTMRHVNSFIYYYGVNGGGKKWWDEQPCGKNIPRYKVAYTNGFFTHKTTVIFDDEDDANKYAERIESNNSRLIAWAEEIYA